VKPISETELWQSHLAVLRQALCMRKPDALARVRSETGRLEREIESLQARKALAERAMAGGGALARQLAETIAERLRRISDLARLTRLFGGKAKAEDMGAAAELAVRPASIDPIDLLHGKGKLDQDQVRAAREIGWVYEAITRAGRARVSRLSEFDPPKGLQEMPLPERAALIHAKRFVPWAERLRALGGAATGQCTGNAGHCLAGQRAGRSDLSGGAQAPDRLGNLRRKAGGRTRSILAAR
jgi:hypothetical protein